MSEATTGTDSTPGKSVGKNVLTHENAPGIEVYFSLVGPEAAQELLKLNTKGQRTVSTETMERYCADMIEGEWIVNGDTIRISSDGELLDGQHRLTAIVNSGTPQLLMIVFGLDKAAMVTIDSGRKRTYSDLLKMAGVSHHTLTAAIISRHWYWARGNYGVRNVGRVDNPQFLKAIPSHAQKNAHREAVEKRLEVTFEAAAAFGHRAYNKRPGISASSYGLAWLILTGIDKLARERGDESDLREEFFHEILVESKSSKSGYPIQALHNRLMNLVKGNDALDPVDQLDALFTVFNGWALGKEMQTVRRPMRPIRWNLLAVPDGYKEIKF